MDQNELAKRAGIHRDRLKAIVARTKPKLATLDELIALATVVGVPERFALEGFAAFPDDEGRIAKLEAQLRVLSRRLSEPGES